MKQKTLFYLFLLIGIISLNASCDKDDPANPIDQLPSATQTGANTAGCLVDGEALLPKSGGVDPILNCSYQNINGEYYFGLSFSDNYSQPNKSINISLSRINIQEGANYILDKNIQDNGDYTGVGAQHIVHQLYPNNLWEHYQTTSIIKGELKITHIDATLAIISGTFWFDAINSNGEIVKVTDGRFDMEY